MTSNPVLKTLRRSWWVIALFTLLGLGVAQVVVALSPTLYSSTDTLYVSSTTKPGDNAQSAYEGNLLSQDRVKSYKDLLGSGMIAGYVADRVGGGTTAGELQANTEVANQPETVLLTVAVTDPSPERAAQIANAYGDVFSDSVRTIEKPNDAAAQAAVQVRTAFPATPYPIPVSPRPWVALPVGLLLGLVAGIGLAVLRRRVDDRLDQACTLAALVGAPDLGPVRRIGPDEWPVMLSNPLSGAAEDVRRLRGSLRHAAPADRPGVVLITSAGPEEGRSTTALELALGLADTGDRVLLLEADLRHPSIAKRLGLPDDRGLVSLLSWECETPEVVQRHGSGLDVVVAGPATPAASERLSSSLLPAVLEELAAPYDWVIVDSPPVTTAADAGIVAPLVTGVVVLARHGRTSARTLRTAVDALVGVGATIIGTTLVGTPAPGAWRDRATGTRPAGWRDRVRPGSAVTTSAVTPPAVAAEPDPAEVGPAAEAEPAAADAEHVTGGELVTLRASNGSSQPGPPDSHERSS